MKDEGKSVMNYNWCARNDPQRLGKRAEIVGNQRAK